MKGLTKWSVHVMEHYSEIKRNKSLIHEATWISLREHYKWKKPDTKDNVLYDSIYMKFLDKKQTSGCLSLSRDWLQIGLGALSGCWRCSKTGLQWWTHNGIRLQKLVELCTYNRRISCYVNYTSMKPLEKSWVPWNASLAGYTEGKKNPLCFSVVALFIRKGSDFS